MGVRVDFLGGGPPPVTSFSDNFNRANNADLGLNWIDTVFRTTPQPAGAFNTAEFLINANRLRSQTYGPNNAASNLFAGVYSVPTRGVLGGNGAGVGRIQFSQITFVSASGPAFAAGPAILCNDQTDACYFVQIGDGLGNLRWLLRRTTNFATLVDFGIIGANGDVCRISADTTVAGQISVTVQRNGATLAGTPFVDNSVDRIGDGYTGGVFVTQMSQQGGVNSVMDWDDFSCGVGA